MNTQQHNASDEEWRDIPSAPGYQASSLGRIRSVDRVVTRVQGGKPVPQPHKGRVLLAQRLPKGYLTIAVARRWRYVHRLVCEAFHGAPPSPAHEVAHGNGVPDDNRAANLRWATRSQNHRDKAEHGTLLRGERHPFAKLTVSDVIAIRSAEGTQREIADLFGIGRGHVGQIRRGERWAHVQ